MKLTIPAGFRTDVVVMPHPQTPGGSPITPVAIAQCWTGDANRASELVRVWKPGMWPESALNEPINSVKDFTFGDLFAVPTSWGSPNVGAACWKPIAAQVGAADVADSAATYGWTPSKSLAYRVQLPTRTPGANLPPVPRSPGSPKDPTAPLLDPSLATYITALGQDVARAVTVAFSSVDAPQDQRDALFAAGAKCPDKVKAALDAKTLTKAIKDSLGKPDGFCDALAASAKPSGMTGGEKVAAGLAALGALWLASRAYKRSKKRRR